MVAMNGATPPENTDASWYTSETPEYLTWVPKSSERHAAIGPYIMSCPTFIASTIAMTMKAGPRCSIQKNGNAISSEKMTPARYTGLRPTRSETYDHNGIEIKPMSEAT